MKFSENSDWMAADYTSALHHSGGFISVPGQIKCHDPAVRPLDSRASSRMTARGAVGRQKEQGRSTVILAEPRHSRSSLILTAGSGSPFSARTSRQSAIASLILLSACWRVFPWLTQPGIAGHSVTHAPSSSLSIVTLNIILYSSLIPQITRFPDKFLWCLAPRYTRRNTPKVRERRQIAGRRQYFNFLNINPVRNTCIRSVKTFT